MSDEEVVRVGLGPSGEVHSVVVDQTLRLSGVGDFFVSLPGPATDVVAPADSAVQPGLRRGRIIWQGFSPGERILTARATLDVLFEAPTLPLRVSVRVLQDGRVATGPVSGPARVEVTIGNATDRVVPLRIGPPEPRALGRTLDDVLEILRRGDRPIAGDDPVPSSLPATGAVSTRQARASAPFRIEGVVAFGGRVSSLEHVEGGTIAGEDIALNALLPSRDHPDGTLVVAADVVADGLEGGRDGIQVRLTAQPVTPDAGTLTPPDGESWARSLRDAAGARLRGALETLELRLWETLLAETYRFHLGNPGSGPSSTRYVYEPAAAGAAPQRSRGGAHANALLLVLVAAALVSGNATAIWRRL